MDAHMEIVNHCHCVSVCVCLCVDVRKGKSRRRGRGRVSVFVHMLVWERANSNKRPKNSRNIPM